MVRRRGGLGRWALCALAVVAAALAVSCGPRSGGGHCKEPPDLPATPRFAHFDMRARKGKRLNVVFFGASLTWGANATDQGLTSYRAVVADALS